MKKNKSNSVSVKDFIEYLNQFDKNKIVFIDGHYKNKNGKLVGCISGIQPQDISYTGYITNPITHKPDVDIYLDYEKDENTINLKVTDEVTEKTAGMTVKEVIEYFSDFREDSILSLLGCYDGEEYDLTTCFRLNQIHDWNNNVLISNFYNKNMETMYIPVVLDRTSKVVYSPSKMTVRDLRNWLNQFDGNIPVRIGEKDYNSFRDLTIHNVEYGFFDDNLTSNPKETVHIICDCD